MSDRIIKVQEQIRRILSEYLVKEGNFDNGITSINDIVVSQDLSMAKVWVSFIAEKNPEAAFKILLHHGRAIQTYLFKKLPVKKIPKIFWQLDTHPEKGLRIEQLLDDISRTSRQDQDISESGADRPEDSDCLPS